jgi:sulfur relay (sulfurtransferase) complex TusBCD TusD component (DsrE family)
MAPIPAHGHADNVSLIYDDREFFSPGEKVEKKKLGILVNTDKNMQHLLGLCKAAKRAGVEVSIFVMDDGTHLIKKKSFKKLSDEGMSIAMCDHSYKEKGYTEKLKKIKHGSQFDHAVIAHECDRYIVL